MPTNYETPIHQWFEEVWNAQREDLMEEMLAPDTIHHGLTEGGAAAPDGIDLYRSFYRKFIEAFPDVKVTVEDYLTDGDKIAARFTVRATHTGDSLGFPATGRAVEFTGNGLCTYRDGKFVEIWNEIDFMKMYAQLGVLKLEI